MPTIAIIFHTNWGFINQHHSYYRLFNPMGISTYLAGLQLLRLNKEMFYRLIMSELQQIQITNPIVSNNSTLLIMMMNLETTT
jgi:hypothetical protein